MMTIPPHMMYPPPHIMYQHMMMGAS